MYSDPNCIFRDFFTKNFILRAQKVAMVSTYFFLLSYIKVSFAQCTMNM